MSVVPVKTPSVVQKMFPKYVWNMVTSEPVIYLTFDDGPIPEITESILQLLKKYDAKATFFCIGDNIEKHPDVFKKIINDGHSVGNHTYNHLKGWKTKTKEYLKNVLKAQEKMDDFMGEHLMLSHKLFRPPYGRIKLKQSKQLATLGYKIIMWDVLPFDWDKTYSEEKVLEHIIKNTEKGSIIVLHDSLKASKNMLYVLPKILEYYTHLGYSFKALKL